MKVFLDDERHTPEGWVRVFWPDEAIDLLKTGEVNEISLDHDLGDDERGTGYDVVLWVEEEVVCHGFIPPKIGVHSANSSAREKMELGIESINQHAEKFSSLERMLRSKVRGIWLSEEFPDVYTGTCFSDIRSGRYALLRQLAKEIREACSQNSYTLDGSRIIDNIKQKYDYLSVFYKGKLPKFIGDCIDRFEIKSDKVCELCGEEGSSRIIKDWEWCLCDRHYNEINSRKIID